MIRTRSLWHFDSLHSGILEREINIPNESLRHLRSLYSLVSNGTERLVAKGQVPPQMSQEMKVPYQEGDFAFPIKYGYSLVACIQPGSHPQEGQLVHLLHPHQDFCLVNEADYSLLPETLPPKRATLVSNLETALNAVWDSKMSAGDRILVVGFGLIGSLIARLVSMFPAVELQILEIDDHQIAIAKKMGFSVEKTVNANNFDVAFHTSGSSEGLQNCIDRIGFEGKVIELSWYGTGKVALQLGTSFHSQRKRILSSQVSHLPAARKSRWDFRRRKEIVFRLLHNPVFDQHITGEISFSESPAFFEKLRKGQVKGLGTCMVY